MGVPKNPGFVLLHDLRGAPQVRGMGAGGAGMKTSELIGPTLDWVVAKSDGRKVGFVNTRKGPVPCLWEDSYEGDVDLLVPEYSTDWSAGGPILEREGISTVLLYGSMWGATTYPVLSIG